MMHSFMKYIYLSAVMGCILLCTSCDGVIYDNEGDCSVNYRVEFKYDYNMKFADAFAHEVEYVTLYLIDSDGNVAWKRTESGEALAADGYTMTVDAAPGTYDMLAWCGTAGNGSFAVADGSVATELQCRLNCSHDAGGRAIVDTEVDRLFHGYLPAQTLVDTEGTYTFTMPLVKDTNSVRVVLQHLSGEPVEADDFLFCITAANGSLDWDNSLLPDEALCYHAWHTETGFADFDDSRSTFSAAIAEFTVSRLVPGLDARLTVSNRDIGEVVLSIPLVEFLVMVKGFYNREMDDAEFLDRQDSYDLTFFLDERDRWISSFIYINSWKVVLQNAGL